MLVWGTKVNWSLLTQLWLVHCYYTFTSSWGSLWPIVLCIAYNPQPWIGVNQRTWTVPVNLVYHEKRFGFIPCIVLCWSGHSELTEPNGTPWWIMWIWFGSSWSFLRTLSTARHSITLITVSEIIFLKMHPQWLKWQINQIMCDRIYWRGK